MTLEVKHVAGLLDWGIRGVIEECVRPVGVCVRLIVGLGLGVGVRESCWNDCGEWWRAAR
jgi:hypothetical protein